MHVVAGKAVCLGEALQAEFHSYAQQVIQNAQALAEVLLEGGLKLVSGGTDNHLLLADVTPLNLGGKIAERALERCGITVNKNMIPFDQRRPMDPSGIRIGTPALTTRGMGTEEMQQVGGWMLQALQHADDEAQLSKIQSAVMEMCQRFPVPGLACETV